MTLDTTATMPQMNRATLRDKILGCWTGKNIGGTLGGPFEGQREINHATFYVQNLDGNPAPNDDLDLQLIWLIAAEENGIFRLSERILGEYWLNCITGPWNEYGVCKANIRNGLFPPLSGSCNNERWKFSNGAWIRSEIWACLFPGAPDLAAQYAWYDSCCDHTGEGIYAEVFTAVLESMAFILDDVRALIRFALNRIPADCRVARAVQTACDCYDQKMEFFAARDAIVEDSADLGWFQAPGNLGFVVLGLLYGEGDFERSVVLANNCGDDTDCTAGTVGAILGIQLGRSGIPQKWIEPIGDAIVTCSVQTFGQHYVRQLPKNLYELTDRVLRIGSDAAAAHSEMVQLVDGPTAIPACYWNALQDNSAVRRRVWERSGYELAFDLPFCRLAVEYDNGPTVKSGEFKKLTFKLSRVRGLDQGASVKILLPENWSVQDSDECIFTVKAPHQSSAELAVKPGEFSGAFFYLPIEVRLFGRNYPTVVHLPLQKANCVQFYAEAADSDFWDARKLR